MSTRKCRLVIEDEVWCYISGLHVEHTEFLYNKFGIFQDGYRYVPAFQMRRWDGKIRFFEKTGKTYVALLEEIIPFLTTWGYELTIDDKREYWEPPTRAQFDEALADFAEIGINPRQYQVDQMWQLIESGNGIGVLATGWGKSIGSALMAATFEKVGYRTITVVPSSDLVTQTAEWFRKCGLDVGEYGGGSKDMDRQHVIATWQSLQNVPHHIKGFQVFTIDECLHPDTLVTTIAGQKPICDIQIGDMVKTVNEETFENEFKPVIKVHKNLLKSSNEKRLKITLDDGRELVITGNHKIRTKTGWKRADELTDEDELYDN